jgi:gamma-glutamyltranspeptidase / glutathione hydrolase
MLVRGCNGSYEFIDFRETAPAVAFESMCNNNVPASLYGGLASGVRGELRRLEHLHKKCGKLEWNTVFSPAAGGTMRFQSDCRYRKVHGICKAGV